MRQTTASAPTAATHLEIRLGDRSHLSAGRGHDQSGHLRELLRAPELAQMSTLSIAIHGFAVRDELLDVVAAVIEQLRELQRRGRSCAVNFTLSADAETALIGRAATSLTTVLEASRALVAANIPVQWSIPLLPELVYRLETLFSLAYDEKIDPRLVAQPPLSLDADATLFLWDFISYRLLEEESNRIEPGQLDFYRKLRSSLYGEPLSFTVRDDALLLLADVPAGLWLLTNTATRQPTVSPADSDRRRPLASGSLGRLLGRVSDVGEVGVEGLRALLQWLLARATFAGSRAMPIRDGQQLPTVLLIGAYGGEHIGDAAILGGVLFRMHRRHGTSKAVLMSQRAHHTRHLVPMLDTPIEVRVADYTQSAAAALLDEVNAVVFAGGPLMDLPKQLVKHLYVVSLAQRRRKRFLIEGIGVGPWVLRPSIWTARMLVRMADRITVRTTADGDAGLVRDLQPEPGRDPAFDYLETRPQQLSKVSDTDLAWINRLLAGTQGRLIVGVNIRPIRHDYTEGAPAATRAEYTRTVEARFEQRLADGMQRFSSATTEPPCFVFFPMNAIQFGMSDLRSAYRIMRLLPINVDFRIWEGDATLDGVVELLRKLDAVIAMRFHAAIFALAQQRPVIGIDYRIGRKDKVGALLTDAGKGENCARIDDMTADWLVERLQALLPAKAMFSQKAEKQGV